VAHGARPSRATPRRGMPGRQIRALGRALLASSPACTERHSPGSPIGQTVHARGSHERGFPRSAGEQGEIKAFLQGVKGLDDFLHNLLWSAVKDLAKKEKGQWAKHTSLAGIDLPDESVPDSDPEFWERLRPVLTRRENDYLDWLTQAVAGEAPPCPFSKARARQLRRSIRENARKLRARDEAKENR
jgi:hypothetical protein